MKTCPRCKLLHPDNTETCECGTDFRSLHDHSALCSYLRSASATRPFRSKILGYAVGAVAWFAYVLSPWAFIVAISLVATVRSETVMIVVLVPLTILWLLVLLLAPPILRLARRLVTQPARAVLRNDKRAPIVYLRSFARDVKGAHTADACDPIEDELSYTFCRIGPTIGLGKPGEWFPTPGVARAYIKNSCWQDAVRKMVAVARAVVYVAGSTEALHWELGYLRKTLEPRRLLLLVPWTELTERTWLLKRCEEALQLSLGYLPPRAGDAPIGLDLIVFDSNWCPGALRHIPRRVNERRPRFRELRTGLRNSLRETLWLLLPWFVVIPVRAVLRRLRGGTSDQISLALSVEPFVDRLRTISLPPAFPVSGINENGLARSA